MHGARFDHVRDDVSECVDVVWLFIWRHGFGLEPDARRLGRDCVDFLLDIDSCHKPMDMA